MISEHRFLKKSICLSIPEEDKRRFYAATINISPSFTKSLLTGRKFLKRKKTPMANSSRA
jgi:hypothetical protein